MDPALPPGVGIDLAERTTFSHLDEGAIRRAADRWLRPDERAWCAAQPSLREALVTVLSCKEAVYKALLPAPDPHELSLTMHGGGSSGWAALDGVEPDLVAATWGVSGTSILALAVASPCGRARDLVGELASGLPRCHEARTGGLDSHLTRSRDTLHPPVTAPS
jgi:hypothetical protein